MNIPLEENPNSIQTVQWRIKPLQCNVEEALSQQKKKRWKFHLALNIEKCQHNVNMEFTWNTYSKKSQQTTRMYRGTLPTISEKNNSFFSAFTYVSFYSDYHSFEKISFGFSLLQFQKFGEDQ